MILRTSRFLVGTAATLIGALAIVLVTLGWRISEGPISLAFLTPYLTDALNRAGFGVYVTVDDTVLVWAGFGRPIEVRVRNARLSEESGGAPLVVIPAMAVSFSPKALLEGRLAPSEIDLLGVELDLVRDADGQINLDFTHPAEAAAGPPPPGEEPLAGRLLDRALALLSDPPADSTISELSRVGIQASSLTLRDEPTGGNWHAVDSRLLLRRDVGRVTGDLQINLDFGADRRTALKAAAEYRRDDKRLALNFGFAGLDPAPFAERLPRLHELAGVNLPLSGEVNVAILIDQNRLSDVAFNLTGDKGEIALPKLLPAPVRVTSLAIKGALVDSGHGIVIDSLALKTDRVALNARATIDREPDAFGIQAQATLTDLPFEQLRQLWPIALAPDARDWIFTNIRDGGVGSAKAVVNITPQEMRSGELKPEAFTLDFDYAGLGIDYLKPMPRLTGVTGTARLTPQNIRFAVASGQAGGLQLSNGDVLLDGLNKKDQAADISFMAAGGVREVLRLVDSKPLGFVSRFGIKPDATSGSATVRTKLVFPLEKTLKADDVKVGATADIRNLAMTGLLDRYTARDGVLVLTVDNSGLDLGGNATIAGVPMNVSWRQEFDPRKPVQAKVRARGDIDATGRQALGYDLPEYVAGLVGADLTIEELRGGDLKFGLALDLGRAAVLVDELKWRKAAGKPGRAVVAIDVPKTGDIRLDPITVDADDLRARGSAVFHRAGGFTGDLQRLAWGESDISARIVRAADGASTLNLRGRNIDLRPFLEDALVGSSNAASATAAEAIQEKPPPDMTVTARFDKARLSETTSVTEVSARYERRHGVAMRVEFDARQQGGGGIDMRLVPEGNGRSLSIVADNAEPIVHYLGFEDIRGGHLRVTGRINSNTDPRAPADVDAQLENFRIQGNIGLAQILTLASFTGISDTLRGEGVFFAKAELPMEITRGRVTLKQARAFGPALGIRADGVIDTAARQVDLRGTVAPATMLNRFLGAIPLIGPLLVGTDSGGLVAISFSAKGPMDKPAISVNPLTILTPGFLRQIFEPSTAPAETVPDNMPKPVGGDK